MGKNQRSAKKKYLTQGDPKPSTGGARWFPRGIEDDEEEDEMKRGREDIEPGEGSASSSSASSETPKTRIERCEEEFENFVQGRKRDHEYMTIPKGPASREQKRLINIEGENVEDENLRSWMPWPSRHDYETHCKWKRVIMTHGMHGVLQCTVAEDSSGGYLEPWTPLEPYYKKGKAQRKCIGHAENHYYKPEEVFACHVCKTFHPVGPNIRDEDGVFKALKEHLFSKEHKKNAIEKGLCGEDHSMETGVDGALEFLEKHEISGAYIWNRHIPVWVYPNQELFDDHELHFIAYRLYYQDMSWEEHNERPRNSLEKFKWPKRCYDYSRIIDGNLVVAFLRYDLAALGDTNIMHFERLSQTGEGISLRLREDDDHNGEMPDDKHRAWCWAFEAFAKRIRAMLEDPAPGHNQLKKGLRWPTPLPRWVYEQIVFTQENIEAIKDRESQAVHRATSNDLWGRKPDVPRIKCSICGNKDEIWATDDNMGRLAHLNSPCHLRCAYAAKGNTYLCTPPEAVLGWIDVGPIFITKKRKEEAGRGSSDADVEYVEITPVWTPSYHRKGGPARGSDGHTDIPGKAMGHLSFHKKTEDMCYNDLGKVNDLMKRTHAQPKSDVWDKMMEYASGADELNGKLFLAQVDYTGDMSKDFTMLSLTKEKVRNLAKIMRNTAIAMLEGAPFGDDTAELAPMTKRYYERTQLKYSDAYFQMDIIAKLKPDFGEPGWKPPKGKSESKKDGSVKSEEPKPKRTRAEEASGEGWKSVPARSGQGSKPRTVSTELTHQERQNEIAPAEERQKPPCTGEADTKNQEPSTDVDMTGDTQEGVGTTPSTRQQESESGTAIIPAHIANPMDICRSEAASSAAASSAAASSAAASSSAASSSSASSSSASSSSAADPKSEPKPTDTTQENLPLTTTHGHVDDEGLLPEDLLSMSASCLIRGPEPAPEPPKSMESIGEQEDTGCSTPPVESAEDGTAEDMAAAKLGYGSENPNMLDDELPDFEESDNADKSPEEKKKNKDKDVDTGNKEEKPKPGGSCLGTEGSEKKVDEKKVDEKKVDEKKVAEKEVDEKKVDEKKVDEKKVDEKEDQKADQENQEDSDELSASSEGSTSYDHSNSSDIDDSSSDSEDIKNKKLRTVKSYHDYKKETVFYKSGQAVEKFDKWFRTLGHCKDQKPDTSIDDESTYHAYMKLAKWFFAMRKRAKRMKAAIKHSRDGLSATKKGASWSHTYFQSQFMTEEKERQVKQTIKTWDEADAKGKGRGKKGSPPRGSNDEGRRGKKGKKGKKGGKEDDDPRTQGKEGKPKRRGKTEAIPVRFDKGANAVIEFAEFKPYYPSKSVRRQYGEYRKQWRLSMGHRPIKKKTKAHKRQGEKERSTPTRGRSTSRKDIGSSSSSKGRDSDKRVDLRPNSSKADLRPSSSKADLRPNTSTSSKARLVPREPAGSMSRVIGAGNLGIKSRNLTDVDMRGRTSSTYASRRAHSEAVQEKKLVEALKQEDAQRTESARRKAKKLPVEADMGYFTGRVETRVEKETINPDHCEMLGWDAEMIASMQKKRERNGTDPDCIYEYTGPFKDHLNTEYGHEQELCMIRDAETKERIDLFLREHLVNQPVNYKTMSSTDKKCHAPIFHAALKYNGLQCWGEPKAFVRWHAKTGQQMMPLYETNSPLLGAPEVTALTNKSLYCPHCKICVFAGAIQVFNHINDPVHVDKAQKKGVENSFGGKLGLNLTLLNVGGDKADKSLRKRYKYDILSTNYKPKEGIINKKMKKETLQIIPIGDMIREEYEDSEDDTDNDKAKVSNEVDRLDSPGEASLSSRISGRTPGTVQPPPLPQVMRPTDGYTSETITHANTHREMHGHAPKPPTQPPPTQAWTPAAQNTQQGSSREANRTHRTTSTESLPPPPPSSEDVSMQEEESPGGYENSQSEDLIVEEQDNNNQAEDSGSAWIHPPRIEEPLNQIVNDFLQSVPVTPVNQIQPQALAAQLNLNVPNQQLQIQNAHHVHTNLLHSNLQHQILHHGLSSFSSPALSVLGSTGSVSMTGGLSNACPLISGNPTSNIHSTGNSANIIQSGSIQQASTSTTMCVRQTGSSEPRVSSAWRPIIAAINEKNNPKLLTALGTRWRDTLCDPDVVFPDPRRLPRFLQVRTAPGKPYRLNEFDDGDVFLEKYGQGWTIGQNRILPSVEWKDPREAQNRAADQIDVTNQVAGQTFNSDSDVYMQRHTFEKQRTWRYGHYDINELTHPLSMNRPPEHNEEDLQEVRDRMITTLYNQNAVYHNNLGIPSPLTKSKLKIQAQNYFVKTMRHANKETGHQIRLYQLCTMRFSPSYWNRQYWQDETLNRQFCGCLPQKGGCNEGIKEHPQAKGEIDVEGLQHAKRMGWDDTKDAGIGPGVEYLQGWVPPMVGEIFNYQEPHDRHGLPVNMDERLWQPPPNYKCPKEKQNGNEQCLQIQPWQPPSSSSSSSSNSWNGQGQNSGWDQQGYQTGNNLAIQDARVNQAATVFAMVPQTQHTQGGNQQVQVYQQPNMYVQQQQPNMYVQQQQGVYVQQQQPGPYNQNTQYQQGFNNFGNQQNMNMAYGPVPGHNNNRGKGKAKGKGKSKANQGSVGKKGKGPKQAAKPFEPIPLMPER